MNIYLVLVILTLPAAPGQPTPAVDLFRGVITASSARTCQAHADNLADLQRAQHADTVRRMGGRVLGTCQQLPTQAEPAASNPQPGGQR